MLHSVHYSHVLRSITDLPSLSSLPPWLVVKSSKCGTFLVSVQIHTLGKAQQAVFLYSIEHYPEQLIQVGRSHFQDG